MPRPGSKLKRQRATPDGGLATPTAMETGSPGSPNNSSALVPPAPGSASAAMATETNHNSTATQNTVKLKPPGLHNYGTTCYFNSVLQALYSIPEFRVGVQQWDLDTDVNEAPIASSVQRLFARLGKADQAVEPAEFWQALRDGSDFPTYGQQDAQEFLRYLLDKLRSEYRDTVETAKKHHPPTENQPLNGGLVRVPSLKRPRSTEDEPDLITELFQGKVVTTIRCLECEEVSSREETFLDISLPVAPQAGDPDAYESPAMPTTHRTLEEDAQNSGSDSADDGEVSMHHSLSWAFRQQARVETMQGREKYHCEAICGRHSQAQRAWRLMTLPPVVTIHFMMFSYEAGKIPAAVAIPMTMRFGEWKDKCGTKNCSTALNGTESEADQLYMLDAVVVHEGPHLNSGHYFTYARARDSRNGDDSRWHIFDDDDVRLIRERSVRQRLMPVGRTLEKSAYLLFYRACDEPSP